MHQGIAKRNDAPPAETIALQVGNYLIDFSHRVGDPISNLKLQKLLYYAQAWYLAFYDKPLFPERIEAWVHGPAVPSVYGTFKGWAWQPIPASPKVVPVFHVQVKKHLDEIMKKYGTQTAYFLEMLTHQEGPWRKARGPIPPDEPSHAVITHDSMKNFYRAMLNGKKQA
jgi:uncharacterized phage-associated protein